MACEETNTPAFDDDDDDVDEEADIAVGGRPDLAAVCSVVVVLIQREKTHEEIHPLQ